MAWEGGGGGGSGGPRRRGLLIRCASVDPFFSDFPCLLVQLPDSHKNGSTRKSSHLVKTWYSKSYPDELMSGMQGYCWLSMMLTEIGTFFPLPPGTFFHCRRSPLAGTFHRRRSPLLKTGFFRQIRELKIQRKNPGSALTSLNNPQNSEMKNCENVKLTC